MRVDKFFSSQEIASRSECGQLIKRGRISVNDVIVKSPSLQINENADIIKLDDRVVGYKKHLYIMLNKPQGVVSATDDNVNTTVVDILPDELKRKGIFPAGRLDKDTIGFVLMTTDGDFAHRILSPQKHIAKTYIAIIDGIVDSSDIEAFKTGMELESGEQCKPATLEIINDVKPGDIEFLGDITKEQTLVRIVIVEGKYHQVKRMFAAREKYVLLLKRVRMGDVILDNSLKEGECRELTQTEIDCGFVQKSQKQKENT